MVYLVISDLHVPVRQPSVPGVILELIHEVDGVISLGDYVDMNTVFLIQQNSKKFFGVHGNMDDYDVKDYLPDKKLIILAGRVVGLCHGWGSPWGIRKRILNSFAEKPQVIIYGHTHVPDNSIENGVMFLNPGFTMIGGTYGLLEINDNGELNFEVHKV